MMAYNNNFIVSVLVNNKPLRELNVQGKRTCTLPFGSEYKIRLKNKHNVRAMASISIDGTDVLCGSKIVLGPKETVDVERFVDDSDGGSKFKFISLEQGEQTGEIQDPDHHENGVIRVEFEKELELGTLLSRPKVALDSSQPRGIDSTLFASCVGPSTPLTSDTIDSYTTVSANMTSNSIDLPKQEKGATVEGSHSDQKFSKVSGFSTEGVSTVIEIFLKGPSSDQWGIFVEGESAPRARSKEKKDLTAMLGAMVLPEDKEVSIKKL